jgi:hypothetical protein
LQKIIPIADKKHSKEFRCKEIVPRGQYDKTAQNFLPINPAAPNN